MNVSLSTCHAVIADDIIITNLILILVSIEHLWRILTDPGWVQVVRS